MPRLNTHQLHDVATRLPEMISFDSNNSALPKAFDLFVCALGFEPRCLIIPEALAASGHRAKRAIYCQYATNREENAVNKPQLLTSLDQISNEVEGIEADELGFRNRLRELVQATAPDIAIGTVFLDLSVMANRLIMKVMKVLLEGHLRLVLLYSEAAVYHPTLKEYQDSPEDWSADSSLGLERGVSDVSLGDDYPGFLVDQLPDCLLVFPSFKKERSRAVISTVDPSLLGTQSDKLVWFLGVPHRAENRWRLDTMREINEIGTDALQYEVNTFDYRDSLRKLEDVYLERVGRYRFWLSPMGSKMQAVGAALFAHIHPDVAVLFAMPKEYNAAQYSDGCVDTWLIDFGFVTKLRESLDQIGTLWIEE